MLLLESANSSHPNAQHMSTDPDVLYHALRQAQGCLAVDDRSDNLHRIVNELMQKVIKAKGKPDIGQTHEARHQVELLEKLSVACLMLMENRNPHQYLKTLIDDAIARQAPSGARDRMAG